MNGNDLERRVVELEQQLAAIGAERDKLLDYVGAEVFMSDFQTATHMRNELNSVRDERDASRAELEAAVKLSSERNHGASGMCCVLREQERQRAESATAEAFRLWRIATCEPENVEAMAAEVQALGTATPEACRAIDAWNRRLEKIKLMEELRTCRGQVRTAQDAACLAIEERRVMETERDEARQRLLSAAGDDLCRLSQEEIKALTSGAVKIPPKEEFLASCERFHSQMAGDVGVLENCLTLAQLIAENERLRESLAASRLQAADALDRIVAIRAKASDTKMHGWLARFRRGDPSISAFAGEDFARHVDELLAVIERTA